MAVIAEFELALAEAEQADGETVGRDQILVGGQLIDLADNLSSLPMLRYAHALNQYNDADDSADVTPLYAAAYELLQAVVAPEHWATFSAVVTARAATFRELTRIAATSYNHLTGRPTMRPSVSSGGSLTTMGASSPDASSRPDLAAAGNLPSIDDLT